MYQHTKNFETEPWRTQLIFLSLLAMLVSLFLSRSALSISMIIFITTSFLHTRIDVQLGLFIRSPLLWGMSLLFLLPLISGTWSEDKSAWLRIMVIKAPLFFMPLAFARPLGFSREHWKWLAIVMITLVVAATGWSFLQYMVNYRSVNEGYLMARSMPTLLDNDRVRFSWLVAFTIFLCGLMAYRNKGMVRGICILCGTWLIIFLHLLSVRTGLISFYIIALVLAMRLISGKKIKNAILVIVAICVLPVIAYFIFPSFQNRVKFFRYELPYFKKLAYIPGGNDATRMISLQAGWDIMNEHPLSGTGLGDLDAATTTWYNNHFPEMRLQDRIAPSSEWLIYGATTGWPGFFVFSLVMLIPFFLKERKRSAWVAISVITGFSFLFDIGLEVQFGVFLYTFITLCFWKWLQEKEPRDK